MKFWLFLGIAAIASAADSDTILRIGRINREVAARPDRALLSERAGLLRDLIIRRPGEARRLILGIEERNQLRPFAAADTLESPDAATTSTVLIADSEDYTVSTHVYVIDTPRGKVTAYQDSAEAPPALCGARISLEGYRLGDVMLVSHATVAADATPQPNCTPIGEHRVAVLMLKIPGLPDLPATKDQVIQQFFDTTKQSTATFYAENSLGQASITGDVFGPFTLDRTYQCSETSALMAAAIKAADDTVDFRQYTHVHMLHSTLPGGCGWAGLGSVGCATLQSPSHGAFRAGYVFENVYRSYLLRETTHEIGHNFGLGHARSVEFPGEPIGPDRTRAVYVEYGDQFSVMGSTDAYHFAAPHKAQLNWFHDGAEFQTVNADAEFELLPASAPDSGLKALRVRRNLGRPLDWVWVEFRQPIGLFDINMSATGWGGALIHYQTSDSGLYSEAVDLTPRPAGSTRSSFGDIVIAQGRVWQDPYSDLTIEVLSISPQSMRVRVKYQPPCTSVKWPSTTSLGPDASALIPAVSAGSGCSWTAQANDYWLAPKADGSGSFQVAANPLPSPRNGSVTVGRQTLFVQQAALRTAPSVSFFAPADGSLGSNAGITFTAGISAPNGNGSIGIVDVQVGDGCRYRLDVANTTLTLFDDVGTGFVPGQVRAGQATRLQNKTCAVSGPTFTATSTSSLSASITLTTSAAMVGDRTISAAVTYAGDAPPTHLARQGSVTVTTACEPGLSARRFSASGAGGVATISLSGTCAWSASASDAWLKVGTPQGTGAASVAVTIAANTGDSRTGSVRINDEIVAIVQAGAGMPATPNTSFSNAEVDLSRGAGSGTVYFTSNLPESALQGVSDSDWLRVVSVTIQPILGPTLQYSVTANVTGARRVGSVTIAGVPLYFSQDGGAPGAATEYTIQTIAGTGDLGDGGVARDAFLSAPSAIAYDPSGNLYIAESDSYRIRKVASDGTISNFAGTGFQGTSPDGVPAIAAQFGNIAGLAVDGSGNVYLSDGSAVRVIKPDGTLGTVATALVTPRGLAVDGSGNLYIAEQGGHRVRKVTPDGKLSTIAGTGTAGNSGDGNDATAAQLNQPIGIAVDQQGNLWIADSQNFSIREVSSGTINTVLGSGKPGSTVDGVSAAQVALNALQGVAVDGSGNLYFTENARMRTIVDGKIKTLAGGGTARPQAEVRGSQATTSISIGIAVSPGGQPTYSDGLYNVVRGVDSGGALTTVAGRDLWAPVGDGGSAAAAHLFWPQSAAVGPDGSVYVADTRNHRIRRIAPDSTITTVAGDGTPSFAGDGGLATAANLRSPTGVAVDSAGVVYFVDSGNGRVRRIALDGKISTLASGLNSPQGLTIDGVGNLYLAETFNHRIRKITPGGTLSVVAGTGSAGFAGDGASPTAAALRNPYAVTADASGNLYIADTLNYRVRVASGGQINTVAGDGLSTAGGDSLFALNSSLGLPYSAAVTPSGSIVIADLLNSRVLEVGTDGSITIIAGNSAPGFDGDGGPAWGASINQPLGAAADAAGNILVMDTHNNRIRLLTPKH